MLTRDSPGVESLLRWWTLVSIHILTWFNPEIAFAFGLTLAVILYRQLPLGLATARTGQIGTRLALGNGTEP